MKIQDNSNIYQHCFEYALDAMMLCNLEGYIVEINNAFSTLAGHQKKTLLGQHLKAFISVRHNVNLLLSSWSELGKEDFWEEKIAVKMNNSEIVCNQIVKKIDFYETYYLITFREIPKPEKLEDQFWYLAHYDNLTGLANRRFLEQRLTEEISSSQRSSLFGALLFFDLDNFKKINDSLGHKIGDQVLIEMSHLIKKDLRTEDVFCRLGGDEFVILLYNLSDNLESAVRIIGSIIKKIIDVMRNPLHIEGYSFYVTASFGVTFFPVFAGTAENALKQADIAMYSAKHKGKNTYSFYHPVMQDQADRRLNFETDLRNSMRDNHLHLVYQPQYNHKKEILGYEALVRWNHPTKGIISPIDFIPMAEETGLIIELGKKIMLDACTQLVKWQKEGKHIPKISINVSPHQFHHDDFVEMVSNIFVVTGVNPKKITLEITENVIIRDMNSVAIKMYQLKKIGVSFAIDDFGTGYSSLAYLKKMPIDQLKIDRSFVKEMLTKNTDASIVNTIISIAQQLGLDLIAEGVEYNAQIEHLSEHGCNGFQGYCLSEPLKYNEVGSKCNIQ